MKPIYALTATLLTLSMFLAACGAQSNQTPTATFEGIETSTEEMTFEPVETGTPGLEGSETPMLDQTETPGMEESGTPMLDRTGTPGANESGTPMLDRTGTPGANESRTPVANQSGTPGANRTGTPGTGFTLNVAQDANFGSYLTDSQGRAVYLYSKDTPNTSTCIGTCAANWSPVLVGQGMDILAGNGVNQVMIGHITRSDGGIQVTYHGWPLYYYNNGTQAGDVSGQGKNNFYLVSPTSGNAINQ